MNEDEQELAPINEPIWQPHSIESEQALLGAILLHNDAFSAVHEFLTKEHFFEPIHAQVYDVCSSLITTGKRVDPIIMMAHLPDGLMTEGMTISRYVAHLAAEATTISSARDYGFNIRDLALQRRLMTIGTEMTRHIPRDVEKFSAEAIDEIDRVSAELRSNIERPVTLAEGVSMAISAAATAYQNDGRLLGMSWGLERMDKKTLGLHPGDLIIIAGRPGMGKTAVMLSVARALGSAGHPGAIFSAEMDATQLSQRMISDEMFDTGPMDYRTIRSGVFSEADFTRITEAGERLGALQVWIDPRGETSVPQIAAKARRMHRQGKLKWMMVDYLQLLKSTDTYRGRRDLEIGEMTSTLKRLAKELQIPVILLSQLNRGVESRDDKRPNLSDLRESGNIEQDADMVLMLYREAYYVQQTEPKNVRPDSEEYASWNIRMSRAANLLDILVEKQRQGPTGRCSVFCSIANNAVRNLVDDVQAL